MAKTSNKAGKNGKNNAQYLGCYIPEDLKSALHAKAQHEGMSVSELVKGLVEDAVDSSGQDDPSKVNKALRAMAERLSQVLVQLKGYKKQLKSLLTEHEEEPPAELQDSFELVESRLSALAAVSTEITTLLGGVPASESYEDEEDHESEDLEDREDEDDEQGEPIPISRQGNRRDGTRNWWW